MLLFFSRLFSPNKQKVNRTRKTSAGQSLVEFALAFPILIILFTGVVEFGFMLNYYLSLLDATREAARFSSGLDPFLSDLSDDMSFYTTTTAMVRASLDPMVSNPSYEGRRIILDPTRDDVIVTVYGVEGSTAIQYPESGPYHIFGTPFYPSRFDTESIIDNRVQDAPNAGILVVEVVYNYHQILALPWVTAFVPNPTPLRAYTIFPIIAAEPVSAP